MRLLPILLALFTTPAAPMPRAEPPSPAPVQPAPPAAGATRLSVASFNLENAMDAFDDPWTQDESAPAKSAEALAHIARTLAEMWADVVVVQEIENEAVLRQINDLLPPGRRYAHLTVQPTNDPRGICVGLLSRHPISTTTSHRDRRFGQGEPGGPWSFARDLLQADLLVDGRPFTVFGVHWKSMRTADDADPLGRAQRLGEAREVRRVLEAFAAAHPGAPFAIAGDFNSDPQAPMPQGDPDAALAHLLSAKAADGTFLLTDTHRAIPRAKRITLPPRGGFAGKVVDYVLVGPGVTSSRPRVWDGEDCGSDHRPVWSLLTLPGKK